MNGDVNGGGDGEGGGGGGDGGELEVTEGESRFELVTRARVVREDLTLTTGS
ncbi:hypothetical protein [Streptosporangium sp. NPDC000396]|uniref:hypothetical protein n=1 Tax=Streptosporangium sp. NPDC000396 TaxID=3366185 RepID=UPI003684930F